MFKVIRTVFGILENMAPRLSGRLAFWLFSFPMAPAYSSEELEYLSQFEERSFIYQGKKVFFRFRGDGPYVLFCHGWAGKSTQFRELVELISKKGLGVLLVDFPAHGKSEGKRTHALEFADVIGHLVEQFDVQHTVMHSLGGLGFAGYMEQHEFSPESATFIATPSIASETMSIYIKQINAGYKTREVMVNLLQKRFNRAYNDFNAPDLLKGRLTESRILVVHDKDDQRAPGYQGGVLAKALNGQLLSTSGLGHNRILKDEQVVKRITEFVCSKKGTTTRPR